MIYVDVPKAAPPLSARLRPSDATTGRRGVPATVTLRRTALEDLRDEFSAERAEGIAFAELTVDAIRFIETYYDQPRIVMHHAGLIGHAASRFLRQRGVA